MMRPVRLHLDTSDYAAMYSAGPGTSMARIRELLKDSVRDGLLEIGISYHIIFELLQKATPEYREDRLARAQLLRELCGQNAFPYPSDLGQGYYFSKEGVWFPRAELALLDVETLVQDLKTTAARDPRLRRGERRAISKRNHFAHWVRANPARLRPLVSAQPWSLPLERGFVENGNLKRYISGETTRDEANRQIMFCFADPVMTYKTWFEHLGRENPIAERRELFADKLIWLLQELHDQMNKVDGALPLLRAEIKEALNLYKDNREAREQFVQLDREVRQFSIETMSPQELTKNTPGGWTKIVGETSALVAAQILYAFHNENRKIKRSDGIDLLHALYLPYTDLWRGDRAFSDLLIKHKVDFNERVVPSLSELPNRIEATISKLAADGA
jgi:hypothetical protein